MRELIKKIQNISDVVVYFNNAMKLKKEYENLEKVVLNSFNAWEKYSGNEDYKMLKCRMDALEVYRQYNNDLLVESVKTLVG